MSASDSAPSYLYLPQQGRFMSEVDRVGNAAYIGGFGSGKTHILNCQVLRESIVKSRGLVGAPTYRMLQDTTQMKFFELCPPSWIRSFSKSENRVHLRNGTEILFRSLETAERLTNLELDWAALDEMGEIPLETYRMLRGRLRRPGGRHKLFGVGNPAGPTHWTYDVFVIKAADHPNDYSLSQATSYENTFLDRSYTREMEINFGTDSLYYKRFVLGQFVAFEGAYWAAFDSRPYSVGGHVCEYVDLPRILPDRNLWRFGRVLDFGFEHPFVLMWYITDGNSIVFFDEYWQRHSTIRDHCTAIRMRERQHQSLLGAHHPGIAYTDHDAQGRAEIQNCINEANEYIGFPCHPADKKVMEGILLVQSLWAQRRCFITSNCAHARIEVPSYRAKIKSIREEPIKEQDDTCDAIRMACQMELAHTVNFIRAKETGYALSGSGSSATQLVDLAGNALWQNNLP